MTNVLLNNVDHHDLRVIIRRGREFGEAVSQVMVFPTEFESLQREFPIVFRKSAEGPLRPVALLGLSRDENLFLDDEGGWLAAAVPAMFQRGPFSIAAPKDGQGEPMIRVDLHHPRISQEEGVPVFLPQGGNSPYLEHVTDVLRAMYLGHRLLDPMIDAFEGAGLLSQVNLEVRASESEVHVVPDVFAIDRQRLAELNAEELSKLHREGFLQSAFMAASSLGNLQRLADLKARRLSKAAE